ncbi:DUF3325 domain-containing protein [Paenalcaligenes sp. Me52]|uniref:DUF3325 domain-containing protein n=1 Tax=Paenalcaligenes sp. Me52 TaxID=3392038 RepID=UPI00143F4C50
MSPASSDVLAHCLIFLPALLGFACLAFSLYRHQMDVFDKEFSSFTLRALRMLGWMLLLVSLAVAIYTMGVGFGFVAYSGHTSFAAGLVFLGLVVLGRIQNSR